jgi:arylsulfatase A-like enzyme
MRLINLLTLCILTCLSPSISLGQGKAPRPNIVYIMADDLGWKDVGYHGSEIKTPHIDALAKAGVRLEQFYVMPVCSPTRASLMTGRYPIRYGLQTGVVRPYADYGLPLAEQTLAEMLRAAGYFTAMVGKWHLGTIEPGYLPTARGFDHHYGHYLGAIDYFTHERDGGLDWHRNKKPLREEGYSTELLGKEAVKLITDHDFSKKPLFLYVPFNSPHSPLQAPQSYLDQYQDIKNKKRQSYAAMVACMDDQIGHIVAALKTRGVYENTLIIFHSDNGGPINLGANNDPLRGAKGSLYAGGVRVVALAVWQGKLKAGTINNEPLHIVDWYPTLKKLTGSSLVQKLPLDGMDLWPTIAGGKPSPHKEILFNAEANRGAILRDGWKLIVTGKLPAKEAPNKVELFHLSKDPSEKTNLAAQQAQRVQELLERLNQYAMEAIPARGGPEPKGFVTPKIWGYFGDPSSGK